MSYTTTYTETSIFNDCIIAEEARTLSYAANFRFSPESCTLVEKTDEKAPSVYMACTCDTDKKGRRFYTLFFHKRGRSLLVQKAVLSESCFLSCKVIQDGNTTCIGSDIQLVWS